MNHKHCFLNGKTHKKKGTQMHEFKERSFEIAFIETVKVTQSHY